MMEERPRGPSESELRELLAKGLQEVLRIVRFSRVEEWLEELRLQRPRLALPYVRLTALFKWDSQFPVIQHVTLCGGFWGEAEYVELRSYCGQRMRDESGEVISRYQQDRERVEAAYKELGLPVRGGYYPAGGGGGGHA